MSPAPISIDASHIDLSQRLFQSVVVAASPAAAAETTICTVTLSGDLAITRGVFLFGWAAYTVGTSGTSGNLRIRRTDTSGTVQAATGALNQAAGSLFAPSVLGVDLSSPPATQVYVLTLTIAAGAATSTVSAVALVALAV